MIKTTKCVLCLGDAEIFGGHVHKEGFTFEKIDEKVIAGTCKSCRDKETTSGRENCRGCYGEWKEAMGYHDDSHNPNSTYGTPKSELLKEIQNVGFFPIAISVMICEETFVFETDAEAKAAHEAMKTNEGWWYGLDGKYPWFESRKQYVDEHYDGDESQAPVVYWLKEGFEKK